MTREQILEEFRACMSAMLSLSLNILNQSRVIGSGPTSLCEAYRLHSTSIKTGAAGAAILAIMSTPLSPD